MRTFEEVNYEINTVINKYYKILTSYCADNNKKYIVREGALTRRSVSFSVPCGTWKSGELRYNDIHICIEDNMGRDKRHLEMGSVYSMGSFDLGCASVEKDYYVSVADIINDTLLYTILTNYMNEISPLCEEMYDIQNAQYEEEKRAAAIAKELEAAERRAREIKLYDDANDAGYVVIDTVGIHNMNFTYRKKSVRLAVEVVFETERAAEDWLYSKGNYSKFYKVVDIKKIKVASI